MTTETKTETKPKRRHRVDKAETLALELEAVRLKLKENKSYDEIAELVLRSDGLPHWSNRSGPYKAVTRALKRDVIQEVGPLKFLEMTRLDDYQERLEKRMDDADDEVLVKLIQAAIKTMQHRGRIVPNLEVDKTAEREAFRIEATSGTGNGPSLVVELAVPPKGSTHAYPYDRDEDDDDGA